MAIAIDIDCFTSVAEHSQRKRLVENSTKHDLTKIIENNSSNLPEFVKSFMEGVDNPPETEEQVEIVKHVLFELMKKLTSRKISNKNIADLVTTLLVEIENLSTSIITELVQWFMSSVKSNLDVPTTVWEVFVKAISLLELKDDIPLVREVYDEENNSMTGSEYKDYVINKLCCTKWNSKQAVVLTGVFKDITLDHSQLEFVLQKILRQLHDLDLEELPSLVYQCILLSGKGHSFLALGGIISHIENLEKQCTTKTNDMDGLESRKYLIQEVQGTILLHITFSIKQNHNLGKDLVKYLKTGNRSVVTKFTLGLCLMVSSIQQIQEVILDYLRTLISKIFKDNTIRKKVNWIDATHLLPIDIVDLMEEIVQSGWEDVTPGLILLSNSLLDGFGSRQTKLAKQCCNLAGRLLVLVFKNSRDAKGDVLYYLLSRIAMHTDSSAKYCMESLKKIVQQDPQFILESSGKLVEIFDYIAFLKFESASFLLDALCPLFTYSRAFRNSVLLVLRKLMFSREENPRMIASYGYTMVIKSTDITETEMFSQSSQLSSSQNSSLADTVESRRLLCHEILSNLKRFFFQQKNVRVLLYERLFEVASSNTSLVEPVMELLFNQLSLNFNQSDVGDLNLEGCVSLGKGKGEIKEPLHNLLYTIYQLILQSNTDELVVTSKVVIEMKNLVNKLINILLNYDLGDFEVDKSATFLISEPIGLSNWNRAVILCGLYETSIEYKLLGTQRNVENSEVILKLFSKYKSVYDLLKEKHTAVKGKKSYLPQTMFSLKCLNEFFRLLCDETPLRATFTENKTVIMSILLLIKSKLSLILNEEIIMKEEDCEYMCATCREIGERALESYSKQVVCNDVTLLLLDVYHNSASIIAKYFPKTFIDFINESCDLIQIEECSDQDLAPQTESSVFKKSIKKLQQTFSRVPFDGPKPNYREGSIIVGILALIITHCKNEIEVHEVIYEITHKICSTSNIDDVNLAKRLISLIMESSLASLNSLDRAKMLSVCITQQVGEIEKDELEETPDLPIINSKTALPAVGLIVVHINQCLTELEWVLANSRKEITYCEQGGAGDGYHLKELSKQMMEMFTDIANVMLQLIETRITGSPLELLCKNIKQFYESLNNLCKFAGEYMATLDHFPSKRLLKLVELCAGKLAQSFYPFITFHHNVDKEKLSEISRSRKKRQKNQGTATARIMRESRLFPNVIYAIESFETGLIGLSKKTKIQFTKHVKRSTSRDFKLAKKDLEKLDEQIEESDSEDEKMKKKKRKKISNDDDDDDDDEQEQDQEQEQEQEQDDEDDNESEGLGESEE